MNWRLPLRFLPACAAGLLAGWLMSRGLTNLSEGDTRHAVMAPTATIKSSAAEWRMVLASRAPAISATNAKDALARMRAADLELRHSPVRAEILKGNLLLSLPAEELAALLEKPEDLDTHQVFAALQRLSELDPELAFTTALRVQHAYRIDSAVSTICQEWVRRDANAAFDAVRALPEGMVRSGWAWALAQAWASAAPATAAARLHELVALDRSRGKSTLPQLASTIVSEWMTKDFAAAKQWVAGLSDAALREKLEIPLLAKQAESDPAGAVAAAFKRRDISGMEREVIGMWHSLYQKDSAAALRSLGQLPEKHPLWQRADEMVFGIFFNRDPKLAEKLPEIAAQLPAGPRREKFLAGFVHAGASNDIPFALLALPLMNESREREQAVGSLTELWMRKDPVKTSEWLASLPKDADSRHSGVARFAENLAPDDPERAAQWAASIPNRYWQKESVMKTVFEKWRSKDPAAAEAWRSQLKTGG